MTNPRLIMHQVAVLALLTALSMSQLNPDGKMTVIDWNSEVKRHNLRTDVSWKAKLAKDLDYSDPAKLKALIGAKMNPEFEGKSAPPQAPPARLLQTIPSSFDLRSKFPKCASLFKVRQQGSCGSCWAFSTMTSLSDRICIATYGQAAPVQRLFSMQDVMDCCPESICGAAPQNACQGGYPDGAMKFAQTVGVVTGDDLGTENVCKPYFLAPYLPAPALAPACTTECVPSFTTRTYQNDKRKIRAFRVYGIWRMSPAQIIASMKVAIFQRGSVVAYMKVYRDFYTYRSGVYKRVWGSYDGGHAVRVIGWGSVVQNGQVVLYWICVNSWGETWGLAGYFWIAQGVNEVSIEEYIVEGVI